MLWCEGIVEFGYRLGWKLILKYRNTLLWGALKLHLGGQVLLFDVFPRSLVLRRLTVE